MIRNLTLLLVVFIACSAYFCNVLTSADSCTGSLSATELSALEALYYSTNGDDWDWKSIKVYGAKWNFTNVTTFDPCTLKWQGITCSTLSAGACIIYEINLPDYNLYGTLPHEI